MQFMNARTDKKTTETPKHDRRLVTHPELKSLGITFSRMHIRRLVALGLFPQPVQISPNRIGWWSTELEEWKEALTRRDYRSPIKKVEARE
jgi:prophage regulatory protein